MGFGLSITYIFLLVLSFALLVTDFFVFADSKFPYVQNRKPLCHDHEKIALLRFKQSFLLNCSASSYAAFAYPKVKSWHDDSKNATVSCDCCRWDGVKCNEETGHVIGLNLSSSCLYGTIPHNNTLFSLSHLRELDLSYNNFNYSQIPSDIGRLYKLTHLNLSKSVFSGQIPLEISTLSNLSLLDLSLNGNPMVVDEEFDLKLNDLSLKKLVFNLSSLTHLYLDRVDISSEVPLIFYNRTSLKAISMNYCNLLGEFPAKIFQLPNLEVVSLTFNPILGGFFPEFYSNSPLRILYVDATGFSGELPTSLRNLVSLTKLDLQESEFYGKIPSSIGNLTNLIVLNLGRNYFSNDLPDSIMNLMSLTFLGLSDMPNVGNARILKSWLPKLNSLTQLRLSQMNLGNNILPSLCNSTRLTLLDLSNNLLTGTLPSWLVNLTHLRMLELYGNHFQGPIPPWISKLVNLSTLFMSFRDSVAKLDSFLELPNLQFLRYQGELKVLSLSWNKIKGDIPQWFVNTTRENLLILNLSNNLLTGFEQPSVFIPWYNLQMLDLNDNKLRGPLPTPPISTQVYQVSNNQFDGVLPSHICHATSLVFLDLSKNNLTGKIPSCISHQLSDSLQVLNIQGNRFSGVIPQRFSKSCNLKMINLSKNQFEGKLLKSLVNCTLLEVLDIGRNRINDSFPSWLRSLPNLQVLVLRHNHFHGKITIPLPSPTIHDFHRLHIFDLSCNSLSGNLPSWYLQSLFAMAVSTENLLNSSNTFIRFYYRIGYSDYAFYDEKYNYVVTITNKGSETFYTKILTVLRVIDFSSNKFTGRIPMIIGNLRGLQALNLSNNNLVGGIPSSLANITDLESLDLSENTLSGVIPQELTKLTFLGVFSVSHNHIVGPIPEGEQFNTFDNSSFAGNLALCGAPLSKKCIKDSVPSSLPQQLIDDEMMEEDSKLIDWIIKSLGCVGGFIIGYVIGKIYVTDRHHDWFMETFGRRRRLKIRVKRSTPRHRGN
ncbi:receptor like protein 30-like [Chenopodium quinoa]|uniref:receptor like protein 30-like n=1 Tax=Chenopodium quinoa TaxID=63459 RepID=UPI000B782941|nr:receptor like protein 30-like [Chenopodium quinoa]